MQPFLVRVTGVRISDWSGAFSQCHLHFKGAGQGDNVARKKRSVIGNNRIELVPVFDVDGATIEVATVLYEHEVLGSVLGNGVHRKNNSIGPFFDEDS